MKYNYPKNRRKIDLDWEGYDNLVREIFVKVKDYQPDVIIANCRGGLPLGVHLAHLLGIGTQDFGCVLIVRHVDDKIASDLIDPLAKGLLLPNIKDKRVLITEDTVGTGETLEAIRDLLDNYGPKEIRATCLFLNERNLDKKWVDYGKVSTDKDWIIFPWEK